MEYYDFKLTEKEIKTILWLRADDRNWIDTFLPLIFIAPLIALYFILEKVNVNQWYAVILVIPMIILYVRRTRRQKKELEKELNDALKNRVSIESIVSRVCELVEEWYDDPEDENMRISVRQAIEKGIEK